MGYYNMIYQYGDNNFINICKKVGVDGLIVVDLPYPENKEFAKKCKKKGISFIQLVSTSRGVANLVQYWLGDDAFGPLLKQLGGLQNQAILGLIQGLQLQ